jgi:hypothetical protein
MKILAGILASMFFLAGCASWGSLYYHERADGTRYYVTRTGALLVVDKDGDLVESPVMYESTRRLQKKGDDWDLSALDVGVPPGHCMKLLSRRPESCLNRIWEGPALVLMFPVLFLPTPPLIGDPLYIYPSPNAVADQQ